MKTAEEIIEYLEAEIAEACELHKQAEGKNAQETFTHLLKATIIEQILDRIKERETEPPKPQPKESNETNDYFTKMLFKLYCSDLITEDELRKKLK